jgi:hypothetical protein
MSASTAMARLGTLRYVGWGLFHVNVAHDIYGTVVLHGDWCQTCRRWPEACWHSGCTTGWSLPSRTLKIGRSK